MMVPGIVPGISAVGGTLIIIHYGQGVI